ncbi:hypothetical protein D9M70_609210 [compost metagenome]
MDRSTAPRAEKSAHRRMAFDLRDEHDIAAVLDADIGGLATRFHQLLEIRPRQSAELAEAAKGITDFKCLDADGPVAALRIMRNHAVICE